MLALGMQQSQEGCGPSLSDIQDEMEMHTSTQNVHVVCSVPQEEVRVLSAQVGAPCSSLSQTHLLLALRSVN